MVINGWVSHLEVDWEQPRYARFMRRLARNLRVLVFDKRGTGMSDRFTHAPTLETRMDDVRAVMDAAGVERAAIFGWGTGGPPWPCSSPRRIPDRTMALLIDGEVRDRRGDDFPWGQTDEEFEESLTALTSTWGDDDHAHEFARGLGNTIRATTKRSSSGAPSSRASPRRRLATMPSRGCGSRPM